MFNDIENFIKYTKRKNLTIGTINSYVKVLKKFQNCTTINEVKKMLVTSKMKPSTKSVYKVILAMYFEFLGKTEEANELKFLKLETQGVIYRTVLTKEEIEKFLKPKKDDQELILFYKKLFLFMFQTGIRADEIHHITQVGSSLYVKGKGRKTREILYKKESWDGIKQEVKKRNNKLLKYEKMRYYLKKIFYKKNVSLHTLRRSFATHMLLNGANPKTVQMQMGHSNINTTFGYLNINKRQKQEEYDKFM
ncbi:tyrosine-type recombinase/integrase [Mycoplasma sp. VS299A]|uniref:tyrosine-type recombinase/integrase n=1 Tax=unclassified Mycoplasma TaxID=2683645 RepID=UPI003AAB2600